MRSILTYLMNMKDAFQKTIAWALVFITVIVIAGGLNFAANHFQMKSEQLSNTRHIAGQFQQIASLENLFEQKLKKNSEMPLGDFLQGETAGIIRAKLQEKIAAIAKANKITISSVGNVPAVDEGGVKITGLNINITGPLEQIHNILFEIETTKPTLFIREISVRSINQSARGGREPSMIAAQFKVYGVATPK